MLPHPLERHSPLQLGTAHCSCAQKAVLPTLLAYPVASTSKVPHYKKAEPVTASSLIPIFGEK